MRTRPAVLTLAALSIVMPCCESLRSLESIRAECPDNFREVAGQQVHLERWGGGGERVLLLHGFAASTYSFRDLGPLLGKEFRAVAVDLNGFGFTERPQTSEAYGLAGQAEMIRQVLLAEGGRRWHIVGHSLGGLVAMEVARRYPELVDRLVLVSPAVGSGEVPWPLRFAVTRTAMYPFVRVFLSSPQQFRKAFANAFHQKDVFTPEVSEEYRERLLVEGMGRAYRGFSRTLSQAGGAEVRPEPVTQPLLVLAGRHDETVPLSDIETFAAGMPGARLEILEESGHSAPEEEPRRVARLVTRFLREASR